MTTPQIPPTAPHQQPVVPGHGYPPGPQHQHGQAGQQVAPPPSGQAPQGQQFGPPPAGQGPQWQQFGPPPQGQQFAPPQNAWAGPPQAQQRGSGRAAPRRKLPGWITIAGALVVVLGSVLPWASVMLVGPVYGTEGDGIITIVCAVVVALVALPAALGKGRAWMFGVATFFGLVATAIAAYDLSNISGLVSEESMASLGPGLPVIIGGGLVIVAASVYGMATRRR